MRMNENDYKYSCILLCSCMTLFSLTRFNGSLDDDGVYMGSGMQAYSCGQSGVLATNVVITLKGANKILSLAEVQLTVFGTACVACVSCVVCVVCRVSCVVCCVLCVVCCVLCASGD